MSHYQLLCHVDPSDMTTGSNKFTESKRVSARAAPEVQNSAALELCWKWEATAEKSGE